MNKHHLAQLNIAKGLDNMESETMSGFVQRLDEINGVADRSEGFVWRLQTEDGDATSIQAFDDPNMIVNLSVWENIESLKQFVYKSIHLELLQNREAWFSKMKSAHQCLWWIPAGDIPSLEDAKKRLQYIEQNGPTEYAFSFAKPFAPIAASEN